MGRDDQLADGPVHDLICPPRTDMLWLIRRVVASVAQALGFAPADVHLIEMSVDEACANVIRHAYDETQPPAHGPAMIRLQIRPARDHLSIRVIDSGCGLPDEGACGVSSIEEYAARDRPRGLGTFIIGRFMDEVAYDSPPERGTVLSMVKYVRSSEGV